MANKSHSARRATSGQALVEFVFILPLLLVLLVGIVTCGILMNNWVILTDAVRSGARELALSRAPGLNGCTRAENRIQAAAIGLVPGSIVVTSSVDASCTNLTAGSDATVTATYPCDLRILGVDYAPGCTLRATSTVRIE